MGMEQTFSKFHFERMLFLSGKTIHKLWLNKKESSTTHLISSCPVRRQG